MITKKRTVILLLSAGVIVITFYILFASLISQFKSTALTKADLIREHVMVSQNIIDGLATYGNTFFEQGALRDAELYKSLKYNPQADYYHLDSIGSTDKEHTSGNLTGFGAIPAGGIGKENVNLALQYNHFFKTFYEKFPDIAWLYYTSETKFINIYPWVSSEDFRYSEHLKNVEFYKVANPANNPSRNKVWTPVYLDAAGKGLMVTLSAPIYYNDSFQGVVSLDLTNAWLSKEIESPYESFLIDDTFAVLASNRSDHSINKIEHITDYLRFSKNDVEKMLRLEENKVNFFGGYFVYASSFHDTPWKLIVLVPVWKIIGEAILYTWPILVICILLLLSFNQIERRRGSEELLKKKNSLLETTLASIEEGIIVTDRAGLITLMNKTAERYTGWINEDAAGKEFSAVFNNINYVTKEKYSNPVKLALESGEHIYSGNNVGLISKDGTEIYISGTTSAIKSERGEVTGAVVSFRDTTREYEQEKQIEGFLNLNLDMLCVVDINGNFHKVNKKFEEIFGYSSEDLKGNSFLSFLHDDDIQVTLEALKVFSQGNQTASYTNRFRCKDGSYKYIEWHLQPRIGTFIYASARDVTEQILKTEELEHIAGRDQLTGTYNRHYFDTIIKAEMDRSDFFHQPLSMALIDMDHFKKVNDTWGHPVGDEVLIQTVATIEETIRATDILIRFGGEEFLLLMPSTTLAGAVIVAEKVRTAIEDKEHPIAGKQTASIGVSEHTKSETFFNWYKIVDHALYEAKENGRNRVVSAGESIENISPPASK